MKTEHYSRTREGTGRGARLIVLALARKGLTEINVILDADLSGSPAVPAPEDLYISSMPLFAVSLPANDAFASH